MTPAQCLGSDEDLAKVTLETLKHAHELIVRTEGAVFVSVGSHDVEMVKQFLSTLKKTEALQFTPHIEEAFWVKPEFHVTHFENISEPSVELNWLRSVEIKAEEWIAICFILRLMVNTVHGVMYKELRHVKGWAYNMDWNASSYPTQYRYGFFFPLNNLEEINYTRSVIFERIEQALQNQELIELEVERRIATKAHGYQTSPAISDSAIDDLRTYGKVHSETEWEEFINKMLDPEYREKIRQAFFTRDGYGETAFFPEDQN